MRLGAYVAAVWFGVLIAAPVVAQTPSASKSPSSAATAAPGTATPPPAAAGPPEREGLVDINAASAEELDRLPGVGPTRAKAIIAHRPYNGKDDLARRKIIPQNVYDGIKDKIIARQGSARVPAAAAGAPSAAGKPK